MIQAVDQRRRRLSVRSRLGDAPSLYDCENSWNPWTGLQCILNGTIVQQVASSVAPPSVLPGIFPVSSATDPNNPNASSQNPNGPSFWTVGLIAAAVAGTVLLLEVKR